MGMIISKMFVAMVGKYAVSETCGIAYIYIPIEGVRENLTVQSNRWQHVIC